METIFTVRTKELKESLSRIKRFNKNYFKEGIVKIRLMPGGIELSTIGVFEFIHGQTEGLAEVFAPLKLLFAFTNDNLHDDITFKFRKGELECGNSIFSNPHIKIESWYNTTDIDLSIKPTELELLKMGHRDINDILKYNLYTDYMKAKGKLNAAVTQCYGILRGYGVRVEEIDQFIKIKLS